MHVNLLILEDMSGLFIKGKIYPATKSLSCDYSATKEDGSLAYLSHNRQDLMNKIKEVDYIKTCITNSKEIFYVIHPRKNKSYGYFLERNNKNNFTTKKYSIMKNEYLTDIPNKIEAQTQSCDERKTDKIKAIDIEFYYSIVDLANKINELIERVNEL